VSSYTFEFVGIGTARTPEQLIQLCAKYPDRGATYLAAGDFERWLIGIGRPDLAHVASESRRAGADPGEALLLFIEYSRMRAFLRRTPDRKLSVLLVGRTGVGKSSTLNTISGREVAETGDALPTTAFCYSYDAEINGVPSRIVDTPGLADGMNMDSTYIDWIRSEVGKSGVDCMLFVTMLHETRVRTDEIQAIELVTNAFGAQVWRRSLILMTFADYFPDSTRYAQRNMRRPAPIREAIAKATSDRTIADAIPFVSLTNLSDLNPDGRRWLGTLELALLNRMAPEGTSLFYGTDPDGGRDDNRFRCYLRDGGNPPPYRFICRSLGADGTCNFCGHPFKKTYTH